MFRFHNQPIHFFLHAVVERLLFHNLVEKARIRRIDVLIQRIFKVANLGDLQIVEIAVRAGIKRENLLAEWQRRELGLLEQFG